MNAERRTQNEERRKGGGFLNSSFCVLHSGCRSVGSLHLFRSRRLAIKRHDDQRLIVFRRAVASELPNRAEKCLLDSLGRKVAGVEQHALDSLEAEVLTVAVERRDR